MIAEISTFKVALSAKQAGAGLVPGAAASRPRAVAILLTMRFSRPVSLSKAQVAVAKKDTINDTTEINLLSLHGTGRMPDRHMVIGAVETLQHDGVLVRLEGAAG